MSNRLLGIPRALAVIGLLGLFVALALYTRGLGVGLPEYKTSKAEIAARARAFAAAQGIDTSGTIAFVQTASIDSDDYQQLVDRFGFDEITRAIRDGEIPVPAWQVRIRKQVNFSDLEEDPSGMTLRLDAGGNTLGADFHEPESKGPALSRPDALRVASERLAAAGIDLTGYVERAETSPTDGIKVSSTDGNVQLKTANENDADDEDDEKPGVRKEDVGKFKFVWKRPHATHPDMELTISATMSHSALTTFDRRVSVTDAPIAQGLVATIVEYSVFGIVVSFIVIALLGVFLSRLVSRDFVSVTRALAVGAGVAGLCALSAFVGSTMSMSLVGMAVGQFFLALFVGFVIWSAWLAGESDAYFAWGRQNTEAAIALLTGQTRSRQVAQSVLEGFLWGWTLLGALAVAAVAVAALVGPGAVHRKPTMYALDAHPTLLFSFDMLPYVAIFSVVCLLFIPSWVHRFTRRAWIAIPIAGAIASSFAGVFEMANVSFGKLSWTPSWGLVFGIGCCVIAARRGWLTAATATFAFMAYYHGLAPVVAGSARDAVMASGGLAIASLPAIAALVYGPRLAEATVREAPPPRMSRLLELARRAEELNIARRVQSALLPGQDPSVSGFDIAGTCMPANEVGGDYYDYFNFPDGRFGVAVGDVSGKGVPAAFCMTLTKGFMEVAAAESHDPGRVLSLANTHLRSNLARGTFVTMAYAVLDPESGTVVYARAGHNPPAILRDGVSPEFVSPPGTALGAADERRFDALIEPHSIELRHGDTLVFYTDGVTEAMSASNEQFGEQRLLDTLERLRDGRSARGLIDGLLGEIDEYARDADQHDDITIVVIKAA